MKSRFCALIIIIMFVELFTLWLVCMPCGLYSTSWWLLLLTSSTNTNLQSAVPTGESRCWGLREAYPRRSSYWRMFGHWDSLLHRWYLDQGRQAIYRTDVINTPQSYCVNQTRTVRVDIWVTTEIKISLIRANVLTILASWCKPL